MKIRTSRRLRRAARGVQHGAWLVVGLLAFGGVTLAAGLRRGRDFVGELACAAAADDAEGAQPRQPAEEPALQFLEPPGGYADFGAVPGAGRGRDIAFTVANPGGRDFIIWPNEAPAVEFHDGNVTPSAFRVISDRGGFSE